MSDFLRQLTAALRVSTPLVAVRTPDPAATITGILEAVGQFPEGARTPVLLWDVIEGLTGLNEPGKAAAAEANDGEAPAKITARPTEMLRKAQTLPEDSIVFMSNAHRFFRDTAGGGGAADVVIQAIWNCRNSYKENGRCLVLLTTLGVTLPAELSNDVLVLDEALPTVAQLEPIVKQSFKNEGLQEPTAEVLNKATDALIGLAAFPAEQAAAMCISKPSGLDLDLLWERKRQAIEQIKGLRVYRGKERFSDLGGLENLKQYWLRAVKGKNRVRLVVFIDEMEKHFAGTGTDMSGVKTGLTGTFLSWMQDKRARGILLIGHGGTGKSAIAKAMGGEAGTPTVTMDFEGMQQSLVGQSGDNLRAALSVIDAMSQGGAFFVGTCNKLDALPPELRRRFKRGIWFCDLPNEQERAAIWAIYRERHNINPDDKAPKAIDWTGAEIEACCETAEELGISLDEAQGYIVPINKSAPEAIEQLREFANNRFLSVSRPGTYSMGSPTVITGSGTRKIRGEGV